MTQAITARPIIVMIGQLGHGGSERQLYFFLKHCNRTQWRPVVCVSGELGFWEAPLRALGVEVVLLRGSKLQKLIALRGLCRSTGATCFFSWSSYTNLFAIALIGMRMNRIGSFRNASFSDLPERLQFIWRRLCVSHISIAVCNSRETCSTVAAHSRARVVFVPNAVDIMSNDTVRAHRRHWRESLGVADDEVLVVGVGRITPQKNFALFIDALSLARKNPTLRAVIAGRDFGPQRALEKRAQDAGVAKILRWIGEVADAREVICAADIFLLSSDFEGMPNVVLEAMAASVACITTPVNGVESLSEGGTSLRVVPGDPRLIADEILRLAENSDIRAGLGARAREVIAKQFDPSNSAKRLWSLCEHMVEAQS